MMQRRILHILGDAGHSGTAIARTVQSLYRHVSQDDFQISACFIGKNGPLSEEFHRIGIPTHVVAWKHPSHDFAGALRLASFLRPARFDLLHFHWGGPTLRRMCKLVSGAKVVFHMHSSVEESHLERPRNISTRHCDAVIAVSKSVAATSQHHVTRVIYPGLEIADVAPRIEEPNLCGCAVRLTPVKGVSNLLSAMALLKKDFHHLRLEILGDGPLSAELKAQSARLGLSEVVRFLGWLNPWDEVRARWAVIVQPSIHEGLGLSVLEAMADGIPVVASRVGGVQEIVNDGETGILVPPADAKALAAAIRNLLNNADQRRKLGSAAACDVRKRFSVHRMAEQTAALYREMLEGDSET